MRYFKYQNSKPMSKVWMLFKDLKGMPLEKLEMIYQGNNSHTIEIIKAALNGSINMSDDAVLNFNLQAYEYKCKENDEVGNNERIKDELHIVDMGNSEESDKVGYGDISSRKLSYRDDLFNEVINNGDFEKSIKDLLGIRNEYIVEKGIDIVQVLLHALKGIPDAVKELTGFMNIDEKVDMIVKTLCENSEGRLIHLLESVV